MHRSSELPARAASGMGPSPMNSSWAREAFTRHVWPSAKAQPALPTMPAACSSTHSYSSHVSLGAELEQVRARCSCRQERSQLLAVPAAHRGLVLHTEKQLPAPLPRCLQPSPTMGCSSNTSRIYSPRGCFTGCSQHTHTKYTTLPANILITTPNKRLI